jgi:hypothetical protein
LLLPLAAVGKQDDLVGQITAVTPLDKFQFIR